jgi:hypothetical protein
MPCLTLSVEYNIFLYSLREQYSEIIDSRIRFFTVGKDIYIASGVLKFTSDFKLVFKESLDFSIHKILKYVYEIYQSDQLICYYDSQPHPNAPDLAATFPHHKHTPPDIKHNRQSAPNISFDQPNLPAVIQEIIDNLL